MSLSQVRTFSLATTPLTFTLGWCGILHPTLRALPISTVTQAPATHGPPIEHSEAPANFWKLAQRLHLTSQFLMTRFPSQNKHYVSNILPQQYKEYYGTFSKELYISIQSTSQPCIPCGYKGTTKSTKTVWKLNTLLDENLVKGKSRGQLMLGVGARL